MPVWPNGFLMRRAPGSYPSKPAPAAPITRGKAWQVPARQGGLQPQEPPPSILIARLTSVVDMVATLVVPSELFSAHLTSVASITAKMASPIKSLMTSTADIAAKMATAMKDLMTSTADIAATMKDPNAGSTGNDSFTKVLLHLNGTNGSTTITDDNAGGSAKTWTANGSAVLDTAEKEFGSASANFDDRLGNRVHARIQTPDHADFHFGSGDFTIDFWFKAPTGSTPSGQKTLFSWGGITTKKLFAILNDTTYRKVTSRVSVNGTNYTWEGSISIADSSGWHHYALVRTGNTLKMFIDGVNDGTNQTVSGAVDNSANDFMVGNYGDNASGDQGIAWAGWIDEFRISKGIARWTSDFTPPIVEYS